MIEALQSWPFSLRIEEEDVQDLKKGSFYMMPISLKDALVLNEEVAMTEESCLSLKYF